MSFATHAVNDILAVSVCSSADLTIQYIVKDDGDIYKSTDSGASFTNITTGTAYSGKVSTSGTGNLIACSADGSQVTFGDATTGSPTIYSSTDGGQTWTTITLSTSGGNRYMTWVNMTSDGVNRCFTYYSDSVNLLIFSTDSGASWSNEIEFPSYAFYDTNAAGIMHANGNGKTVYLPMTTLNGGGPGGIIKYTWTSVPTDGSFTDLTTGKTGVSGLAYWGIAVASNNPNIVTAVADGGGICVSTDGGSTWTNTNPAETYSVSMSANGTIQLVPSILGLYYSLDTGSNWLFVAWENNVSLISINNGLFPVSSDGKTAYIYTSAGSGSFPVFSATYTAPPVTSTCLVKGTNILTVDGYKKIEQLKKGDIVVTETKPVVIKNIHSLHYTSTTKENAPYTIHKNAFGLNCPPNDISVSGRHAVQLRPGVWEIPEEAAKVNKNIVQDKPGNSVIYYHIELPDYANDNLIANGQLVESLNNGKYKESYIWDAKENGYIRKIVSIKQGNSLRL